MRNKVLSLVEVANELVSAYSRRSEGKKSQSFYEINNACKFMKGFIRHRY